MFLHSKVSFESDTSVKDSCITREQSLSTHDVVNDQGFAMHYRAISNTVNHLFSDVRGNMIQAEQKYGLTSFLMLNVLEAEIFQYDGHEGQCGTK